MASIGENFTFQGGFKGMVDPFNFFHGKKKSSAPAGPSLEDILGIIDRYTYKPTKTAETEQGLYNLFQNLTGQGGGGVEAIPFDIGLPTTGLYDALTRGIKEDYLGTPGGPEGGQIADMRAYYNNLGIPEQAINQERLANKDLNNSLVDTAAQINEAQKDRLTNVLGLGANVGSNLYGQNLAQHRANAGLGLGAVGIDVGIQDSIRQANQQSLNDLLGGIGSVIGTIYSPGIGTAVGQQAGSSLGNLLTSTNPNTSRNPSSGGYYYGAVPSLYGSAGKSTAKLL
jgi:hypothetical protein